MSQNDTARQLVDSLHKKGVSFEGIADALLHAEDGNFSLELVVQVLEQFDLSPGEIVKTLHKVLGRHDISMAMRISRALASKDGLGATPDVIAEALHNGGGWGGDEIAWILHGEGGPQFDLPAVARALKQGLCLSDEDVAGALCEDGFYPEHIAEALHHGLKTPLEHIAKILDKQEVSHPEITDVLSSHLGMPGGAVAGALRKGMLLSMDEVAAALHSGFAASKNNIPFVEPVVVRALYDDGVTYLDEMQTPLPVRIAGALKKGLQMHIEDAVDALCEGLGLTEEQARVHVVRAYYK